MELSQTTKRHHIKQGFFIAACVNELALNAGVVSLVGKPSRNGHTFLMLRVAVPIGSNA